MNIATKFLVMVTTLLAVDLSDSSDAQLCNAPTVFQCVDNKGSNSYLQCTPTGVDDTKPPEPCVANPPLTLPAEMGCYGTGPIEDICFVASCEQGAGNYPIPKATNAFYTCAGPPNKIEYVGVTSCDDKSYIFDVNGQNCEPPPTTTTQDVTTSATLPAPGNPSPICSGQRLQPDPTSCNHFYVCAGTTSGPGIRKRCPFKKRFDVGFSKCKFQFLVNCGTRPDTTNY